MVFTLPNFNLVGRTWNPGHNPATDPPDFVGIPLQLYVNSRQSIDIEAGASQFYTPLIIIRTPLPTLAFQTGTIVESVTGSSDYYLVRWLQNYHQGFPNEYLGCSVSQCSALGVSPRP